MNKIRAIFFDAGGTLFAPFPSVGIIYARTAAKYGIPCDPDALERAFVESWQKRGGLSSLGETTNEEKERAWWQSLVSEVFYPHSSAPEFQTFFDELHKSFVRADLWQIFPEVEETLEFLKKRGYFLGVISNWDLRLPLVIRNVGLEQYFNILVGSSACGATKPSPKIFQEALRLAGVSAEKAVHVGDTYEEDYVGAQGVGMIAYHLDRADSHNHVPPGKKLRTIAELLVKL